MSKDGYLSFSITKGLYGQNRRIVERKRLLSEKSIVWHWLRLYNGKQRAKGECTMKIETTPIRVIDKIMELRSGIVLDAVSEYVPVAV